MRYFSLTICLFLHFGINAQNFPSITDSGNISRVQWRDSIFRMDKSQIPTGFLLNYSLFGFDPTKYDGVGSDDTLKEEGGALSIHSILWHSKVNNNASIELTDSLFSRAFFLNRSNGSNPMTFIYQKYNKLSPYAISNNQLRFAPDSIGILDVIGRIGSPYDTSFVFCFAPFKTEIVQFGNILFSLPVNLFYAAGIDTVEVDFGDGFGYRKLAKGAVASIYYQTVGIKYLKARIQTASGVKSATSMINYSRPMTYNKPDTTWTVYAPAIYQNESQYLGVGQNVVGDCDGSLTDQLLCPYPRGAEVAIRKSCDGIFDKPILIVEGFDPKAESSFDKYWVRFEPNEMLQNLASFGYDFVVVRFTHNNDFIENNAAVLEEVIKKVNLTKTGTNKINIIGISMGGLITRWCLKDMEERGVSHNVDNYFSYDSPHQGVNIPLGTQYMFREFITDLPFLKWIKKISAPFAALNSRAAKQMIVVYGNGASATLNPIRAAFAARLQAKGFPSLCKKLGISVGRGDNTVNTKSAGNGIQFTPANPLDPGDRIFSAIIPTPWLFLDTKAYAVKEAGQLGLVTSYKFYAYKPGGFFLFTPLPVIRLRSRDYRYIGQYPYEDAPGGFESTQGEFADKFPGAGTDGHYSHNFASMVSALNLKNQGYSASNFWQSNTLFYNIDNQILNKGQVGGNTLPNTSITTFDAIMTSTSDCGTAGNPPCTPINVKHSAVIPREATRFMSRYIRNAQLSSDCNNDGFCSSTPSISGLQRFCSSANYQLLNFPNGVNINWTSVNGRFSITAGQGTPNISISSLAYGSDIVRVTLTNACGLTRVFEKSIILDHTTPIVGGSYNYGTTTSQLKYFLGNPTDYNEICNLTQATTSLQLPNTTSINWSFVSASQTPVNWYQTGNNATLYLWSVGQTVILRTNTSNTCGTVTHDFGFKSIYCGTGGGGGCESFSVYPNPASDIITFEAILIPPPCESISASSSTKSSPSKLNTESISLINIFDSQGNLVVTQKFLKLRKVSVNVSNLKLGTYTVEIVGNSHVERKKILVKKN